MPSFFTWGSSTKPPKKHYPVFAGLDDPFNFPASKMRYNSHSLPRTSSSDSTDSGYGSIDDGSPLSPKAPVSAVNKRRLEKDGKGNWGVQRYEHQSEDNEHTIEKEAILGDEPTEADDEHMWKPDSKRTLPSKRNDKHPKPKWNSSRIYGTALERKEKSEGLTNLQRSMAPILRRPPPYLSPSLPTARPPPASRKNSTLLHPSSPLAPTQHTDVLPGPFHERTRPRKQSTLLHPSPPRSRSISPDKTHTMPSSTISLRSPRNRALTPLGIPTSSETQPAPTPLRIHIRNASVLHSCFSDEEGEAACDDEGGGGDAWSNSSVGSGAGEESGVGVAQTGVVGRAVRVRVRVRREGD